MLSAQRRVVWLYAERLVASIGRLLLLVAFAVAGALTVTAGVAITLATMAGGGLLLLVEVRRWVWDRSSARAASPARPMLRYGLAAWGGTAVGQLNVRLDQIALAPLVPPNQLGYYAVAVSLAELPYLAVWTVREVTFSEAANRGDPWLVVRAVRATLVLTLAYALVTAATASFVVELLFGSDFAPAAPILRVLALATMPLAAASLIGAGLMAIDRPGARSLSAFAAIPALLVGIAALAGDLEALGGAIALLLSGCVSVAIGVMYFARATGLRAHEILVPRRVDIVWLLSVARDGMRRLALLGRMLTKD